MSESTLEIDRIEVTVSGIVRTRHLFQTEAGTWGELEYAALSERASFTGNDGRELMLRRTSWLAGRYEISEGEEVLGQAHRRGVFRRGMLIEFAGRPYDLEPAGIFSRSWQLMDEAGTTLLVVGPRGLVRRGAILTVTGPVAADLIAFAYFLVYTHQREEASHVAATAGASS